MINLTIERELHEQLDNLPMGQQQQVLDFARALAVSQPQGVPGWKLLPLAGTINAEDLAIMAQAEEDCEQINSQDW